MPWINFCNWHSNHSTSDKFVQKKSKIIHDLNWCQKLPGIILVTLILISPQLPWILINVDFPFPKNRDIGGLCIYILFIFLDMAYDKTHILKISAEVYPVDVEVAKSTWFVETPFAPYENSTCNILKWKKSSKKTPRCESRWKLLTFW